ncbi:MAG: hypothetical protein H3C50_09790 [Kiritimatiellae bacterium]|nr:hypothetical protein [Kiritimatiellia bacterium]MCO5067639.1 hypothetical protein [Kiritimatiellia bacterium]
MKKRRLRAGLEVRLAQWALRVIPTLTRPTLCHLARFLGRAAYFFGGSRTRDVADANLKLVFPTLSNRERRRLSIKALQSFALSMLDVFWVTREPLRKLEALVAFHPSYELLFQPGAVICITAHMGNWELLGMAVSRRGGEPLTSVAATIKNPRVDALFNDLRQRTGQHIVARKGAVRSLLKTLREGRKIALVLDQNTKPVDGGVFVNFLGRPAPISSAPALLALRTGAPVIVGCMIPNAAGTYETLPMITVNTSHLPDDQDLAVQTLSQRIADVLSELIRQHPEHWAWSYKRWKFRPETSRAEDFPFYSRPLRTSDLRVVAHNDNEAKKA